MTPFQNLPVMKNTRLVRFPHHSIAHVIRKLSILTLTAVYSLPIIADKGLGMDPASKPDVCKFVVNTSIRHQTIDNFSASDGWSMQFIGLWPDAKQNKMADWLFSTEMDASGRPKGIGLSLWRFNIGAGSSEQGDSSKIDSPWTRSECFLRPDNTYDWTKQKGQRHFMQLAKQRGVNKFLGFILSAPVYWTQNGLATNTGRGATFNLKEDRYDDYCRFMADVVEGLKQHEGVKLDYICPFNEPDGHWNWVGPKQEGTAATNQEIAKTVRILGDEFAQRKIDTEILVSESFDYNCLFRVHPYVKADRGFQIQSFFSPDSTTTYIGKTPNVTNRIVGHSYWTNTPLSDLRSIRIELGNELKRHNLKFWQTELCIMGNDKEIGGGGGADLTMKTALYVARVIHHDLVYANASAWQWWRSVASSDYRDGLIYTQPDKNLTDGTFSDSKLMWTLGNYSRFIRPGAKRLNVTSYNNSGAVVNEGDTDPYAIMISAYENQDKTPVIVVVNYQDKAKTIQIKWDRKAPKKWQPYYTTDTNEDNLAPKQTIKYGSEITVPARSVITLVGK